MPKAQKDEDGAASASSDDTFTSKRRHATLPDAVLFSCVISRLLIEDLLRCRLVCRAWSTTIASSSSFHAFRLLYAPLEEPWLLAHHPKHGGECLAFNPNSSQWHKLSLGGIPMAAASGFLIYSLVWPHSAPVRLAVFNPFTHIRMKLPATHVDRIMPFVGAFAVNGSAHFKVVVAGGDNTSRNWASTEVYDSLTNSWSYPRMESGEYMQRSWYPNTGVVCCDGIMYCLVSKVSYDGENGLMAYDIESGVWRRDQAYDAQRGVWDRLKWRMEEWAGHMCLVKSTRGGLMLLGRRAPHTGSPLCLWQLVSAAAGGGDAVQWGDEREVGSGSGQGLASARTRTFYLISTRTPAGVMECKDFADSFPPQWKMLSPFPPFWLLDEFTTSFLLEPGAIPCRSISNSSFQARG